MAEGKRGRCGCIHTAPKGIYAVVPKGICPGPVRKPSQSAAGRAPGAAGQLLTDAQLGNDGTIPLDVLLGQIVQHLAALTDHLQQAAAAVVVVDVDLQVLGQLLDAGGEDGDLDLGGASIGSVGAVCLNDGSLFVLTNHG